MTALSDLRLAAQQRCDRVNSPITTQEWNSYINASVGELYGLLTSTYQDYNVKQYAFTLAGGSQANNQIVVGPSGVVTDFFQPRALWLQVGSSPTPFITIPRLESLAERNLFTVPQLIGYVGSVPSRWNLLGSTIEVLPSNVGGASYVLWYVPTMPQLVLDTDTIDNQWLTVNGWQEYIVTDVAMKALLKEESLDSAALLMQLKQALAQRIIRECMPRDISGPQAITDMNRVRNPFGGRGGLGGSWGGGWGGGGGMW